MKAEIDQIAENLDRRAQILDQRAGQWISNSMSAQAEMAAELCRTDAQWLREQAVSLRNCKEWLTIPPESTSGGEVR